MTDAIATFEAKIAPELGQFVRPLGDATRHPDNIRKHRIDKIAQSLRAHGQRAAIVVQSSTGLIVKGNGTHEAAELLGWTELAQIWQEMDDQQAIGFLYADNKASDFSSYDRDKTIAGLKKMVAGPGLFDTLWDVEELEDLIEAEAGATILEPSGSEADNVRDKPAFGTEAKGAPPERMKEIPIIMTLADHAAFVEQLKGLAKEYGTSGTIATIAEAVRRQAVGESAPVAERAQIRRELIVELRDYFLSLDKKSLAVSAIVARLESAQGYVTPKRTEEVVEGQLGMDEATAEAPVISEPEAPAEPAEDDDVDDAEALANLAAYRASREPKA